MVLAWHHPAGDRGTIMTTEEEGGGEVGAVDSGLAMTEPISYHLRRRIYLSTVF